VAGSSVHLNKHMPSAAPKVLIQTPLEALKKHFGHGGFLDGQDRVIGQVTSGRDGLVVMPTGGGKSLCYQLPALCLDRKSKCLKSSHRTTS